MKYLEDLTGLRFGKLVVIEKEPQGEDGCKPARWRCRCDCGNETVVARTNLISGHARSCGCGKRSERARKAQEMIKAGEPDRRVCEATGLSRSTVSSYRRQLLDAGEIAIAQCKGPWVDRTSREWTQAINKIRRYYGKEEFPLPGE